VDAQGGADVSGGSVHPTAGVPTALTGREPAGTARLRGALRCTQGQQSLCPMGCGGGLQTVAWHGPYGYVPLDACIPRQLRNWTIPVVVTSDLDDATFRVSKGFASKFSPGLHQDCMGHLVGPSQHQWRAVRPCDWTMTRGVLSGPGVRYETDLVVLK
jgi:hypothetical protein